MADQSTVVLERANSALVARDFTYAEKLLVNLLRQEPSHGKALDLLGTVYTRSDRWEQALSVYLKLSEINPDNVEVLNNLGVIYRRIGRYEDSISVLTRARETGQDTETVLYNLGNTWKQMGDYAQAALCFSDVIDNKPDDVLAYNHLGSIHALSGRHDLALQAYRRGLQIDPNHPFIHYNMAHSYEALGRPSEAVGEFTAALKTKPGWLDALRDLASLYLRQKDEDSCLSTLRRILAVDPSDTRALVEMGSIASKNGRTAEAADYYSSALKADPFHIPAALGLVQLREKEGKLDDALADLQSLNARSPGLPDVLIHLARLYVKLQQYPEAKAVFRELGGTESENIAALAPGRMYAQLCETSKLNSAFPASRLDLAGII